MAKNEKKLPSKQLVGFVPVSDGSKTKLLTLHDASCHNNTQAYLKIRWRERERKGKGEREGKREGDTE